MTSCMLCDGACHRVLLVRTFKLTSEGMDIRKRCQALRCLEFLRHIDSGLSCLRRCIRGVDVFFVAVTKGSLRQTSVKATIGLGGAFVEDGEYAPSQVAHAVLYLLAFYEAFPCFGKCSICQVATWRGNGNISWEGDAEVIGTEDRRIRVIGAGCKSESVFTGVHLPCLLGSRIPRLPESWSDQRVVACQA